MAELDPDQYKRLTKPAAYGTSDGLYKDETNSQLAFVLDDTVVATVDGDGITVDLEFSGEAQGDVLRHSGTAWELHPAGTSGQILVGDGSDIVSVAVSGDVALSSAGATTVTDLTIASEARGDLLRRGASAWERVAAVTKGSIVKGDGTDVTTLAVGTGGQKLTVNAAATDCVYDRGKIVVADWSNVEAADNVEQWDAKDYTARDTAAQAQNLTYCPDGTILGSSPIGDGATIAIVGGAAGLEIGGDVTANDGFEIYSHIFGADGRPFVVGHDAAFYFLAQIVIADVSACDDLFIGFRKMEALNAAMTGYNTYAGIGIDTIANPAALKVIEELNGAAGASTDTTETIADTVALQIKVLVSSTGVTTFETDSVTPGTLAPPGTTSAFTFDDGDAVIPIVRFLRAASPAGSILLKKWEAGYQ